MMGVRIGVNLSLRVEKPGLPQAILEEHVVLRKRRSSRFFAITRPSKKKKHLSQKSRKFGKNFNLSGGP